MIENQAYPNPLNDKHCDCLNQVLARSASGKQLAKDCADCGLDTSGYTEQFNAQEEMARKLKGKFFPNRS